MRQFSWCAACALLSATALAPGCGTAELDVLFTADGGADDAASSGDGARPLPDGGGTQTDYCNGSGPPAIVAGDGGVVCAGGIAQSTFRFALCTCDGLVTDHVLATDAFDGAQGPYDPAHAKIGGSVGSDGNVNASAKVDVGGSLWASDPTGLTTNAAMRSEE